jgi:hypothetical protein
MRITAADERMGGWPSGYAPDRAYRQNGPRSYHALSTALIRAYGEVIECGGVVKRPVLPRAGDTGTGQSRPICGNRWFPDR